MTSCRYHRPAPDIATPLIPLEPAMGLQVFALRRGRLAAQQGVAVRKAPELSDHVPVCDRITGEALYLGVPGDRGQFLKQGYALLLHLGILTVFQRQIQKDLVNGRQALVVP